jgi:hypothetical protein
MIKQVKVPVNKAPRKPFTFDSLPSDQKQKLQQEVKTALKKGKRYATAREAIQAIPHSSSLSQR